MTVAVGPEMMLADELDERVRRIKRRAAASRAAFCLHLQRPELAREAGARGGATRGRQLEGKSAYMRWLARRRFYGALAGPSPATGGAR